MPYLEDSPKQIPIDVPAVWSEKGIIQPPMMTSLFPENARLIEELDELHLRCEDTENMRGVVVGYSNGAEIYSLGALHNKSSFGGRIAIFGYDKDHRAQGMAHRALYKLPFNHFVVDYGDYSVIEIDEVAEMLEDYGFSIDKTPYYDSKQSYYGGYGYQINAKPVEKDNDFAFGQADVRFGVPKGQGVSADMVQATGLLHNLGHSDLHSFLENCGKMLRYNGFINLGDPKEGFEHTHEKAADYLWSRFGLEPILFDATTGDVPVMFARP